MGKIQTGLIIRLRLIITELNWILNDPNVKRPLTERKMLENIMRDLEIIYDNLHD